MYDAMTNELIDLLDNVKTLAEQPAAQRRKFADAALGLDRTSREIATQAVKLTDSLARQSATTVADGLAAAAQLCRSAMESDS
ncbi:hypothetical protein FAZ69_03465 [Trinickia terrae]|uniref:Uncharacterized protein n=1 Tax=Trinickia terrae TaxID=2571161 RepID=A0A4U1IDJ4_9BURK|nr:hypothetical protein [Trinickia terrae]TKC91525.1 hypothetical protein FAZ69_03465 [Trinickia terrae]